MHISTIIPDFTPEQKMDYNDILMEMLSASESCFFDFDAEYAPYEKPRGQVERVEVL